MLGLVLGSGGARGWAHVGVLKALRERGIQPDIVVGTSIGSIIGAVYAEGKLDEAIKFAGNMDKTRAIRLFLEIGLHRDGLLSGVRVMECLKRFITTERIENLPLPFAAVATDLDTGMPVVLHSGSVLDAIRASISIPGIFTPVKRRGATLVDGGLSSPVPVSLARQMGATDVIAVNIDSMKKCPYGGKHARGNSGPSEFSMRMMENLRGNLPALADFFDGMRSGMALPDVLLKTTRIAEYRIAKEELSRTPPELLIEPAVGDIATMDFSRADDAIRAGYEETLAALDRRGCSVVKTRNCKVAP